MKVIFKLIFALLYFALIVNVFGIELKNKGKPKKTRNPLRPKNANKELYDTFSINNEVQEKQKKLAKELEMKTEQTGDLKQNPSRTTPASTQHTKKTNKKYRKNKIKK